MHGRRRPLLVALPALALAVSTTLVGAGAASATPAGSPGAGSPGGPIASGRDLLRGKVAPALESATGTVTAFVQLKAPSGLDVADKGGDSAAVRAATAAVEQQAKVVVPDATAARGASAAPRRIATLGNLVSATIVVGDAAKIRALASSSDVVALYRVVPQKPDNTSSDVFTRALTTWQSTGQIGKGVRIGVIDTGLDYTHAAFGGPGTTAAYQAVYGTDGTGPVPAGLFDPAKFLGGHDFAGPCTTPTRRPRCPAPRRCRRRTTTPSTRCRRAPTSATARTSRRPPPATASRPTARRSVAATRP